MNWLDWTLLAAYICGLMFMSFVLGRSQRNSKDYYLAGNDMGGRANCPLDCRHAMFDQ